MSRFRWAPHNLLAHPLGEVLAWTGVPCLLKFAGWLHDVTLPETEDD